MVLGPGPHQLLPLAHKERFLGSLDAHPKPQSRAVLLVPFVKGLSHQPQALAFPFGEGSWFLIPAPWATHLV